MACTDFVLVTAKTDFHGGNLQWFKYGAVARPGRKLQVASVKAKRKRVAGFIRATYHLKFTGLANGCIAARKAGFDFGELPPASLKREEKGDPRLPVCIKLSNLIHVFNLQWVKVQSTHDLSIPRSGTSVKYFLR